MPDVALVGSLTDVCESKHQFGDGNSIVSIMVISLNHGENKLISVYNKARMAGVGAARMAQNNHRTELVFMFEKNVFWFKFWFKLEENIAYAEIAIRYLSIR